MKRAKISHMFLALFLFLFYHCESPAPSQNNAMPIQTDGVPSWASSAIWYQIFVERFYNGSSNNNPTRENLIGAWPDRIPETWVITPWTQDWYKPDPWFADCDESHFYHGIQARRYGGDLIGVLQKLEYLKELGINAIYFNPLNHAPSLHKYDPTYYHHIDASFGPDPQGDLDMMSKENHGNPEDWVWTEADKLFIDIIRRCHELGIRVVMDYSWNHTGRTFWAFRDVMENGQNSAYKDWYYIESFNNPETEENEFQYKSWFGATTLPELKEDLPNGHPPVGIMKFMEGNIHSESLKQHIKDVTRRWLDPNNDGDPSDGVDGFRMDVAAEIPVGFWREYRDYVKSVNPEAILIGELWYEEWPDKLLNPIPFFENGFDASMNYRWYRIARRFFGEAGNKSTPTEFKNQINEIYKGMSKENQYAQMNLVSGHDSPRVLTSLFNNGKYKYQAGARDNADYKVHAPDIEVYDRLKMLLLHQFTFFGAPHIWNGDEFGMWGADDPDCRKPLWWPEFEFENESHHPAKEDYSHDDPIKTNTELLNFYKQLTTLRSDNKVLSVGEFTFLATIDSKDLLAYSRHNVEDEIIVLFNRSTAQQGVSLRTQFNSEYHDFFNDNIAVSKDKTLTLTIAPKSFRVLIKK